MKHTAFSYVKLTLASMLVLLAGCACAWRLMKIQIVESDTYTAKRISTQKYTQTISATRGEIVDSSGKAIIENKVGYNVIIEPDTFPEDNAKGKLNDDRFAMMSKTYEDEQAQLKVEIVNLQKEVEVQERQIPSRTHSPTMKTPSAS